jgi:hypothetical protein
MTYNPLDPGAPGGGGGGGGSPAPKPSSGSSGHKSSGGSSGGGSSSKSAAAAKVIADRKAQYTEAYKAWYLTLYNKDAGKYWKDPSVQKQVHAALAGKYPASLTDFQAQIMRYDANYLKSDVALNNMNSATSALQDLFPGEDMVSLQKLVEQSARLNWNADTLRQNVMQTDLWKKNYAYYAESGLTNPAEYQNELQTFRSIMGQAGLNSDPAMEELLFTSKVGIQNFQQNWDAYQQGNPSLAWYRGQGLTGQEAQAELFNQPVANYTAQQYSQALPTAPVPPTDKNKNSAEWISYNDRLSAYNRAVAAQGNQKNAFDAAEAAKVQAGGYVTPGQTRTALQNAFTGQKNFMASQANPFKLTQNQDTGQITTAGI